MKRNFNEWFSTFRDTIATWKYYTDFDKVYRNTNKIKDELNILNGLIGVENIEDEFRRIVEKFPQTLKAIPILIAKRESEIKIIVKALIKNKNTSIEKKKLQKKLGRKAKIYYSGKSVQNQHDLLKELEKLEILKIKKSQVTISNF